ncbi:MAG: HTH domain-containing protein [Tissierellaceae bacterium]|nr:HTH domain-containing protein [Tissierellaceae bacterium]
MEKLVEIGILFDFYGKLLSKKQYSVVELYYIHDLSLSEIGEELNISRQGVYDTLKRAEQKLYKFEKDLGLIKKFNSGHDSLRKIISISQDIMNLANKQGLDEILEKSMEINRISNRVLENNREVME